MLPNFSSFGDPEIARFAHILASKPKLAQDPTLPEHLDKLLDQPWTPESSRRLDLWAWYLAEEFQQAGGAR